MSQSLLTVKELSSFLHVHPNTVYKWTDEKRIPFIKLNGLVRFNKKQIEEWQNQNNSPIPENGSILPNLMIPLPEYDRMILKGRSALSKNSKRWNYGFGAVYTRKTKQGKERWYIDYRDEEGKRIQRIVKNAQSRDEAVIALQQQVLSVFSREHNVKQKPKKTKFLDFAEQYVENYAKVNKRSWKTDECYLQGMMQYFSKYYLDEITSLHIEKYKVYRLKQNVRPSTVNRCLAILRKMFNLAVEWDLLKISPMRKIKFYSEKDNLKERILTKDEETRLLEESAEHLKPILIVALNTGMRRGEILNLKWNQVDLKRKTIRVEETKSGKMRFISVNTPLLHELQKHQSTKSTSDYLFINPKTGKPLTSVKTAFKAACRRAGIFNLRFHDLRHTFASRLVERGIDLITVKELLGHSSVKITERYTHSQQERKIQAVEALTEKTAEKEVDLLHICDTARDGKRVKPTSSLFSVN
ncbi:MAG: tyrosine-type recombinase/integrase [Candidatus Aminicenantes bacterium]|nr:tyrosine-type recombinase/integrase [Candidatus Aminicenantes bacterium]